MGMEQMLLFLFALTAALAFGYKKLNEKKRFCTGIDINKPGKKIVPESGGIVLLVPFWIVVLWAATIGGLGVDMLSYGAIVSVFTLVGLFDDLKHKFLAKPASWKTRALPIAIASLIFAGIFAQNPLWIIPLALFIAGTASLENTFAGLNGWEVGSGFIISVFASVTLLQTQFFFIAASLAAMIFALLLFNAFPARIFPGDSGTLFIGSSLSALMVLTKDITLIVLLFLFFLPHMVDFFLLKLLSNRKDMTQQKIRPYKLLESGRLGIPDYPDGKTRYDFAKLLIKIFGPQKETTIVLAVWEIVIANCLLWLWVFGKI